LSLSVPTIAFTVIGEAKSAGSKRAFRHPHTGRIVTTEAVKGSGEWKNRVADAGVDARSAAGLDDLLTGPLWVEFIFVRARPASHFGTGRNRGVLKPSAPVFPSTRPDALKLGRAVEDALTGVLWRDDAQIVNEYLFKRYGSTVGCEIRVWDLEAVQHDERRVA
jgi:Holliday junction resolvase RusA-like endonuclease